MYSDELLRKYLKYFVLIVSVIVLLLGFLWLNFLYTRHQRNLENLSETIGESIQEEVQQKAHFLRLRGDEIYLQAKKDLETHLVNQGALLRAEMYDILFEPPSEPQQREKEISRIMESVKSNGIFEIHLISNNLVLGKPLKDMDSLQEGINERGSYLIYYDESTSFDLKFYIYLEQENFIKKQMAENIQDFILWDTGMYIRNEQGEQILASQERVPSEEGFFFEEYSPETGFSFGYFIAQTQLEERLEDRREIFSSFLRNHILEVMAFLLIFIITSVVLYRMILYRMEDYYIALNEEILEAYRGKSLLSDKPKFQHFALGDSFDSILRESQIIENRDKEKIQALKEELKKNKLERLLLERKVLRLSELPYTKTILHNYTMESFSPKEIIREVHRKIDPEASILISGSDDLITNDLGLFKASVEEVFQLTREEKRSYTVEILRDSGQMLLFFSLHGLSFIEDQKMQELKNRAKLLDGVFLRHQMEAHTLHLVLSLNDG